MAGALFRFIRRNVRRSIQRRREHVWNSTVILIHPKAGKVTNSDRWYWDDDAWHLREVRAERDLREGRYVDYIGLERALEALQPGATPVTA
jgi:hypothetical protein